MNVSETSELQTLPIENQQNIVQQTTWSQTKATNYTQNMFINTFFVASVFQKKNIHGFFFSSELRLKSDWASGKSALAGSIPYHPQQEMPQGRQYSSDFVDFIWCLTISLFIFVISRPSMGCKSLTTSTQRLLFLVPFLATQKHQEMGEMAHLTLLLAWWKASKTGGLALPLGTLGHWWSESHLFHEIGRKTLKDDLRCLQPVRLKPVWTDLEWLGLPYW